MPRVTFWPGNKSITVQSGVSLLTAGRMGRAWIRSRCGGNATCLMCKVIVQDQKGLSPINDKEQLRLGELTGQGYRLACQSRVIQDVSVLIPEDPLKAVIRAQLAKQQQEEDGI